VRLKMTELGHLGERVSHAGLQVDLVLDSGIRMERDNHPQTFLITLKHRKTLSFRLSQLY
jgi:hypothetical protein